MKWRRSRMRREKGNTKRNREWAINEEQLKINKQVSLDLISGRDDSTSGRFGYNRVLS